MGNKEAARAITPYCFQAQNIEGGVDEYLEVLDFLEGKLKELEDERGEPINALEFHAKVSGGLMGHETGKLVMGDLLVVIGLACSEKGGNFPKTLPCLRTLRSCVTSQPPPGTPGSKDMVAVTIPRMNAAHVDKLTYPLDKLNATVWASLMLGTEPIALRAEARGSEKQIDITYAIDFDKLAAEIPVARTLTPYDKRVYVAAANLYDVGNTVITLRQIHNAMGNTGKPAPNQRKKISQSIEKMSAARIRIDNTQEAGTYRYPRFVYKGQLLPSEGVEMIVNGNIVEEAIHMLREPPVMAFAKGRAQITTLPLKLLQSPLNKTEMNMAIEDYLLNRVSRICRGNGQPRILYETVCVSAGITDKKQKARVPERVEKIMAHWLACNFITSFSADEKGVTVTVNKG